MPQAKQVGNGWLPRPWYVAMAAPASSGCTGSTSVRWSWLHRARSTGRPSYDATTPAWLPSVVSSSARATGIGVSSGGGASSETSTVGHGRAWSVGQSSPARAAIAPALQPPLPDEGGPQKRAGTIRSVMALLRVRVVAGRSLTLPALRRWVTMTR